MVFRNVVTNRFFWRRYSFFQLALFMLMAAFPQPSWAQSEVKCKASSDCFIEYDHLSDQDTDPFLFLELVMDETRPRWKEYRRAIRRYPDVRSCLMRDEANKSKPSLLRFDWRRVGTGKAAEVCIFRIASSLGTVDRVKAWMEYHGFSKVRYVQTPSRNRIPGAQGWGVGVAYIGGWWTTDQYREVNPSLLKSITGIELVQRYSLGIYFNEDGKVVHVGTTADTK